MLLPYIAGLLKVCFISIQFSTADRFYDLEGITWLCKKDTVIFSGS